MNVRVFEVSNFLSNFIVFVKAYDVGEKTNTSSAYYLLKKTIIVILYLKLFMGCKFLTDKSEDFQC